MVQWAETGSARLFLGEINKNDQFYQGAAAAELHVEGELSPYHKKLHADATGTLRVLYSGVQEDPRLDIKSAACPENIKASVKTLDDANAYMRKKNIEGGKDADLGIIRYNSLLGQWRVAALQPELKHVMMQAVEQFCQAQRYPSEWANLSRTATNTAEGSQRGPAA